MWFKVHLFIDNNHNGSIVLFFANFNNLTDMDMFGYFYKQNTQSIWITKGFVVITTSYMCVLWVGQMNLYKTDVYLFLGLLDT